MTKYCEIIRLHSLNFIERNIALSCSVSETPCQTSRMNKSEKQPCIYPENPVNRLK